MVAKSATAILDVLTMLVFPFLEFYWTQESQAEFHFEGKLSDRNRGDQHD
jgi:hypothetical protein